MYVYKMIYDIVLLCISHQTGEQMICMYTVYRSLHTRLVKIITKNLLTMHIHVFISFVVLYIE